MSEPTPTPSVTEEVATGTDPSPLPEETLAPARSDKETKAARLVRRMNRKRKQKRDVRWDAYRLVHGEATIRKEKIQEWESAMTKLDGSEGEFKDHSPEVLAQDVRDILLTKQVSEPVAEAVGAINESYSRGKETALVKILGGAKGNQLITGRDPVQAELVLRVMGCRTIDELSSKCSCYAKIETDAHLKQLADEATKAQVTTDLAEALKHAERCQEIYKCIAEMCYCEDDKASSGLTKDQLLQFFSVELEPSDTKEDKMRRGKLKVELFGQWINGLSRAIVDFRDFPASDVCDPRKITPFVVPAGKIREQFRLVRLDLGLRGLSMDKNGVITLVSEAKAKDAALENIEKLFAGMRASRVHAKPEPKPDDTEMGHREEGSTKNPAATEDATMAAVPENLKEEPQE